MTGAPTDIDTQAMTAETLRACLGTLGRQSPQSEDDATGVSCALGSLLDEWSETPALQTPDFAGYIADLLTDLTLRERRTWAKAEVEAHRYMQLAVVTQIAWLAETTKPFAKLGAAHLSLIARAAESELVRDGAVDALGDLSEGQSPAAVPATGELTALLHGHRDGEMRRRVFDWLYCRAENLGKDAANELADAADAAVVLETRPALLCHIFSRLNDAVAAFPALDTGRLDKLHRRFTQAMMGLPGVPPSLGASGVRRVEEALQSRRLALPAEATAACPAYAPVAS